MRFPGHLKHLLSRLGLILGLAWTLVLVGLVYGWLPFAYWPLLLMLALALPLGWPKRLNAWYGLLATIALAWLPALALRSETVAASELTAGFLVLLILSALAAAPTICGVLMWRQRTAPALMLWGFALFPMLMTLLLSRVGLPLGETPAQSTTVLAQLAWLPALYYPILGMCLGSLGFIVGLAVLLVREAQGGEIDHSRAPPDHGSG